MSSVVSHPATPGGAYTAGGTLQSFRSEFPAAPLDAEWEVSLGAGMSLTAAQGNGSTLAVTMGTTTNSVTTLTSRQVFSAALLRATASIQLSQKIVNNQVAFELVGCDADGNANEAVNGGWRFWGSDSVTTTQASLYTQNGAAAPSVLSNQTVPAFVAAIGAAAPTTTFELEHLGEECIFAARTSDSTNARSNSYLRNTVVPVARYFRIRLRFANTSSAPASSTTAWVGHVLVDTFTQIPVEITTGRGSNVGAQGLPVNIVGTPSMSVSGTPTVNVAANQVIAGTANAASTAPSTVRFDALLAAAQTVKASANAKLYWATFHNPNAAMAAVHFYNATAPTVGTTTPILTVPVPANQTVVMEVGGIPYLNAATALTVAATTTATTAGNAAPAVGLSVSVGYL